MKKNEYSLNIRKNYSKFSINILAMMLCGFSTLQGDSLEVSETASEEALLNIKTSEETAALDISFFPQQPVAPREIPNQFLPLDLHPTKNSFIAVSLSTLIPGFGHIYLGDAKTAISLAGVTGLSIGGATFLNSKETSFLTLQNTWCYGIYAAYRDARTYNGQSGYSYKMPVDNFNDLARAPFNLKILKKPEVWGGLLGKFTLALAVAYFALPKDSVSNHSWTGAMRSFVAFPVGLGEESFFRGFLQSRLSETFTPWGGIFLSSLIFGAVHIPNAQGLAPQNRRGYYSFGIPLITLSGMYYGWLTYKNQSLQESVALHTWYDFILIALGSLAEQAVISKGKNWMLGMPF